MRRRLAVTFLAAATVWLAMPAISKPLVNIMGGPDGSTAMEFAKLVSEVGQSCGYESEAHQSQGALENIVAVREGVNNQFGIVQSDVLEYLRAYESEDPEIAAVVSGMKIAFTLFDQEVHILASKSLDTLEDLEGKRVSIGAPNSGDFLTATVIFDLLGYGPAKRLTYGPKEALAALKAGSIDAMFLVDGAPSKILATAEIDLDSFHLLDITDPILEIAYTSETLAAGSYPFQPMEKRVVTVKSVAMTYDYVPNGLDAYNTNNCNRVADLTYLTKQFLQQGKALGHPKWSTIDLEQEILDWDVSVCAAQGLSANYKPICR